MPKLDLNQQWQQQLDNVDISKDELNRLVMHYLLVEGYKDAAEALARTTNVRPAVELDSIQARMEIRQAIQQGHIEDAIERINEQDPELLDAQADLYFKLQQQRLIEYLRQDKIQEALTFAQEELAQRGIENPALLEELERTMALFAFEDAQQSPLAHLMQEAHRQQTASELNAAMLAAQSLPQNSKLPTLLHTLFWSQRELDARANYPKLTDILNSSATTTTSDTQNEGVSQSTPISMVSPSSADDNASTNNSRATSNTAISTQVFYF
ncbi:CTLH/CRA C-terminal to lish motif domain-containing protein [Syncephalis plumigaleata]|nr:CTLH/CRA C-terminal to lish motif domain-containing protein [Syncephalis plumigaleata]